MLERRPAAKLFSLFSQTRCNREGEDVVIVSSLLDVGVRYMFRMGEIYRQRRAIASLLSELPEYLMQRQGVPHSGVRWVAAMNLRDGRRWAYTLQDADRLLALGRAAGMVAIHPPERDDVVCDMPYATILRLDAMHKESLLPRSEQCRELRYWRFRKPW